MKQFLALLACTALLVSCETAPPRYVAPPLNFTANGPINVNVAEVRVISNYQSPLKRPSVEHEFPTPPDAAIRQWVKQRIYAVGTQGVLEVSIDDASVKEVPLPKTKGLKGLVTNDQDARYDANIHVTVRLYNGTDAMSVATGDVQVSRSKSIAEKTTIEDHERLFDSMTRDMLARFDSLMAQRLRQYFAAYLR